MADPTEAIRRELVAKINANPGSREALETIWGKGNVFDSSEVAAKFELLGFMAPFVVAREKATGKKGMLEFQHLPRFYYNFIEY